MSFYSFAQWIKKIYILKEEQDKWNEILDNFEDGENQINSIVSNLPIVAIGDSVMLGAIDNLHSTFPHSYVDAKVSRSLWKAIVMQ